ncbi:MAG: NADP oxidoreductase, partial [Cyanobacteria bacterium P01_D01_bin.56]
SHLLPKAYVVKAFNTIFADVMGETMEAGQAITAFIAGDNNNAKQTVIALARDIGYAPVDTGPLFTARYLESMAHLNIQIAVGQGGGTNAAFVYLQRKVNK